MTRLTRQRKSYAVRRDRALLGYMDGAAPETDYTRALDKAVTSVRRDEKWRLEYMVLAERDRERFRLGRYAERVAQVRRSRNRFNVEELASLYYIDLNAVKSILNIIDAHPDWDDETVAENVSFE